MNPNKLLPNWYQTVGVNYPEPIYNAVSNPYLIEDNICAMTDSYKFSHWKFIEPGTQRYHSYMEARSNAKFDQTTFFGLQYYIKRYLMGKVVTEEKIRQAEILVNAHMPQNTFNRYDWKYVLDEYGGYLPIEIKAVPEGTNVDKGNILVNIENTVDDERIAWIPNYLETLCLKPWYTSTVCTLSNMVYRLMLFYAHKTGTPELVPFSLHDFGYRGVSSEESAGLGGVAHLAAGFMGSDTTKALIYANNYYGCNLEGLMASIPATEHSIVTAPGLDKEVETYGRIMDKVPDGLLANVSDSKDIWYCIREIYGKALKEKIMSRNGTFVTRPDSGRIDKDYDRVLFELWQNFKGETNKKGYEMLDSHMSTLWGDGCELKTIADALEIITEDAQELDSPSFSTDNVHFGMGGGLLQRVDRDTQSFAFKCSAVKVNGQWRDVYKNPVGDRTKASKRGRLALIPNVEGDNYVTVREEFIDPEQNCLQTVFKDGECLANDNLLDIRARATNVEVVKPIVK